jgi:hypothetical protein
VNGLTLNRKRLTIPSFEKTPPVLNWRHASRTADRSTEETAAQ